MATRINIRGNGGVLVRVLFDVTKKTLRFETGLTDAGTMRVIGDAILEHVEPAERAAVRSEIEKRRRDGATVGAFANEIMKVVRETFAAVGLPEDYDIELGVWPLSPDEIVRGAAGFLN